MTISATPPAPPVVDFGGRRAATAVRWSSLSVLGRQGAQLAFALVAARLLGPETYGVITAATIYVTLTTLLLDQGVSAALVQRPDLPPRAPGAAALLNLLSAILLAALTWLLADPISGFFSEPRLEPVLLWLGAGLLAKALAIAPRALLLRDLRLKAVAVADIAGAAIGAAAGITAALVGAGPFALVVQTLIADVLIAALLLAARRGPGLNLSLRSVLPLLPFGAKVFGTNGIAFISRNSDNILVGRFLGVTSLSYYGMAYRVLVIPVQMLGQTVNRVMFPVFSRSADEPAKLREHLLRATELLAVAAIPPMALLACAAVPLVELVLGPEWLPAAPLVSVLAIAGARETLFYITPALMRATGRAGLGLWYEVGATGVQLTGILIGLTFGLGGVAWGYTAAGFVLVPALLLIQRRLATVTLREQLAAVAPAIHATLWAAAAYLLLALLDLPPLAELALGAPVYAAVAAVVLALFHRDYARRTGRRLLAIAGRGGRDRPTVGSGDERAPQAEPATAPARRVVLVTPNFENNSLGRTYVLWLLARSLGWRVDVVGIKGSTVWTPLADSAFAADCRLPRHPRDRLPAGVEDASAIRALVAAADLVLAVKPLPTSFGLARRVARQTGTPLMLDIDDPDIEVRTIWLPRAERVARMLTRRYWTLRRLGRLARRHPRLVSNPALQARYGGTVIVHARTVPPAPGYRDGAPRVAFVGSPRGHKGLPELRTAVGSLSDRGYRLSITADAPDDARRWETWHGSTTLEEGLDIVAGADIVAIPSLPNSWSPGQLPAKLIDAMILGRAVVASDTPPIRWALGDGGIVVPAGDTEQLRLALLALEDPAVRRAHGERARTRALELFSVPALAPVFADAVTRALASPTAARR